ncbi:unnamed protein product [Pocillopora meandrina]|uniref:Uncharacterized protein n=1 Tax=Pocillopora meandrina TaxID=46732 RepID=A0AAU9XKM1_9CNID|nr:unnamed protein product [Pocillopora meandrina]
MDIERMKKLLSSGIEAGNKVKEVREVIKSYKTQKQDMYDDTAEILKPSIEIKKKVKETIDEKQNKLIKKLQENKETVDRKQDEVIRQLQENQIDDEEGVEEVEKPKSLLDPGATEIIKKYGFDPTLQNIPSENEFKKLISSTTGKQNSKNAIIKNLAKKESKALSDYLKLVKARKLGITQKASGIYTQPKRNAYKISQRGQYGGLVIDLPKLYGHLNVVAHKNGQKVYDKQADFDTLDLLTKRFNSKKKYSELARSVFNDLNRLSEIPIHRTSKKQKVGVSLSHDFTTKFKEPIKLSYDMKHELAVRTISMTYSWYNIKQSYGNNQIKYSHDKGTSWETITFVDGMYSYDDIDKYIKDYMKSKGHIIKVDEEEKYGINLYFVLSTYRVLIELEDDYQIDLRNSNFRKLIGFN